MTWKIIFINLKSLNVLLDIKTYILLKKILTSDVKKVENLIFLSLHKQ